MRYAGCHLARHEVDREWPKSLQASLHFKFLLHPARQFHDGRDILGSGAPQRERRAAHSLRARGSVSPFPSRYRSSTRCACRCASASAICSPINSSVSHASTPCWTIVGASVAYHLARQGVSVTLIDRASSPAAGVTGDSFAWIGNSGGDWHGGAEDLRSSVLKDYRRLEVEVLGVAVRRAGSLTWSDASVRLRKDARLAPGQYWIGRSEVAALEPNLRDLPERTVYTPTDGGVDPVRTTEALVHAARTLGTQVVFGSGVASLNVVGGRVEGVLCSAGYYPASTVVLASDARGSTTGTDQGHPRQP